jgi:hypothetical protein
MHRGHGEEQARCPYAEHHDEQGPEVQAAETVEAEVEPVARPSVSHGNGPIRRAAALGMS